MFYAEPGMYYNIALLDVASLHPHSAVALNYFGDYTKNFNDLMDVRIYVKHGEYDKAKKLLVVSCPNIWTTPHRRKHWRKL